ncbi:MAG: M48 family metallopeptidase [Candidatus Kapabacteria bacterium]|jgi:Zn-dependent protease with chaperone function|nr:M48 family metallopeptidase [Candidatus Kapabacteria bacterium]
MRRSKVIFPNISPRAWEHPADRAALSTLQSVPGLDTLLQKMIGATTERSLRLVALSSAVRVSERQFAKVNTLFREACHILDVKQTPELYVSASPFVNARAVGMERPFIMLNSSLLETLSEEELLAVIAHELGHCLSGHLLYSTLLVLLTNFTMPILSSIPLGGAAVMAVRMALMEWYRKSELSCDRAGLLVVQDPDVCYTLEMKLAGGRQVSEMNINEFFAQAYEYESGGTMVDSVHKILNLLGETHPFPVLRLVELKKWVDSGEYARILSGGFAQGNDASPRAFNAPHYATPEDAKQESVMDNIKSAAKKYKEELANSSDPLAAKVSGIADSAADTAKTIAENLKKRLENKQ